MTNPTLLLITGLPGSGKTSIAEGIAKDLQAAVIGHDWVMAGLRVFPTVWNTMSELEHLAFRSVGWSVMWNIAIAQVREGRSVVLDGVARAPEVQRTRDVADEAECRSFVALCSIADARAHRERVIGRDRNIPNWPELTWEDVERSRSGWEPPTDIDLILNALDPVKDNLAKLRRALYEE